MDWLSSNWAALASVVALLAAFVFDMWLKFTGRISISELCWKYTQLHPTLYSLGFFLTYGWSELVGGDEVWLQRLIWYLSGHLFSGIAYVAVVKRSIARMAAVLFTQALSDKFVNDGCDAAEVDAGLVEHAGIERARSAGVGNPNVPVFLNTWFQENVHANSNVAGSVAPAKPG